MKLVLFFLFCRVCYFLALCYSSAICNTTFCFRSIKNFHYRICAHYIEGLQNFYLVHHFDDCFVLLFFNSSVFLKIYNSKELALDDTIYFHSLQKTLLILYFIFSGCVTIHCLLYIHDICLTFFYWVVSIEVRKSRDFI